MKQENAVVERHSVKLNVRLNPLLSMRREGEGLSARLTAICDRFKMVYEASHAAVKAKLNDDELEQLVEAYCLMRPEAGWLAAYSEKAIGQVALHEKLRQLTVIETVVLEELLVVLTCARSSTR